MHLIFRITFVFFNGFLLLISVFFRCFVVYVPINSHSERETRQFQLPIFVCVCDMQFLKMKNSTSTMKMVVVQFIRTENEALNRFAVAFPLNYDRKFLFQIRFTIHFDVCEFVCVCFFQIVFAKSNNNHELNFKPQ